MERRVVRSRVVQKSNFVCSLVKWKDVGMWVGEEDGTKSRMNLCCFRNK